jgi:type VI protein secretion system component VasF
MSLVPYLIVWAVLAAVIVGLLIYRRFLSEAEDDTLHVSDPTGSITSRQVIMAKKLEVIDRWGKILTVIAVLYGVALLVAYLYLGWVQSTQLSG